MTPAVRELLQRDTFSPYRLANIAARYDLSQLNSLVYDGSNRVQLVGDLSGNSAVNGLVMNGVAGNSASAPDSAALSITGDMDIRVWCALADWTPSAIQQFAGKRAGSTDFWQFGVNTNGTLLFTNKVANVTVTSVSSTAAPTVSDFGAIWVRVAYDVDNGASGNDVLFYTSPDGVTWTKLGNTVTTAGATSISDTAAALRIGTSDGAGNEAVGTIFRAQIYNGIAGTLAFDANFTAVAKLATSFTESSSNAATVTINTSGRFGARICGARDRVNMTQAEQPILTIAAGGNYLTYDGSNDVTHSAPFPLPQPFMRYSAASLVTWTVNRSLFDGGTVDSCVMYQRTGSPGVSILAGGAATAANTALALNTRGIYREAYNGANGGLGVNLGAPVTASIGTNAANGITVGASGGAGTPSNITESELIIYSANHDAALQLRIARYMVRKNRVALP